MSDALQAVPEGTLVDRALTYLASGPGDSSAPARGVVGLPNAAPPIARPTAGAPPAARPPGTPL